MKKVLVASFRQESNSFSIFTSGHSRYVKYDASFLANDKVMEGRPTFGLILEARDAGLEVCYSQGWTAGSGGPVEKEVADDWLKAVYADIDKYQPDALFLGLHGATDMLDHEDLCGYLLENLRKKVGPDVIITHTADMHANISDKMAKNANACAGYNTYPHNDMHSTGRRAAKMGIRLLNNEPFYEARVRIPMIVQAEAYDTNSGVFAELHNKYHKLVADGTILDFSIFQMQPWFDLPDSGSTVLVCAEDKETAEKYAHQIADELFALRKEMEIKLYDVDEVIEKARTNESDKPIILVDSADSPNAGSSGDSTFVLEHLLKNDVDFPCVLSLVDKAATLKAFELGVGGEADFTLGASLEPNFQKQITVHAYVKSLHDSLYEGPRQPLGLDITKQAAVLQVGKIYIVVMARMGNSSYPVLYTGAGLDLRQFRLIAVKSATQYKLYYKDITDISYPTDTPGSSSANLAKMPFKYIPRPFWPLDKIDTFENKATFYNEK